MSRSAWNVTHWCPVLSQHHHHHHDCSSRQRKLVNVWWCCVNARVSCICCERSGRWSSTSLYTARLAQASRHRCVVSLFSSFCHVTTSATHKSDAVVRLIGRRRRRRNVKEDQKSRGTEWVCKKMWRSGTKDQQSESSVGLQNGDDPARITKTKQKSKLSVDLQKFNDPARRTKTEQKPNWVWRVPKVWCVCV